MLLNFGTGGQTMTSEDKAGLICTGFLLFLAIATFANHDVLVMFVVTMIFLSIIVFAIADSLNTRACRNFATAKKRKRINDDFIREMARLENDNDKKIEKEVLKMEKVIIRAGRAGVFFGEIKERNGSEVTMTNVRRLWYWDGACSISQLAVDGTAKPTNCKFSVTVAEMTILGVIEIIPCTEKAIKNIEGVTEWKK